MSVASFRPSPIIIEPPSQRPNAKPARLAFMERPFEVLVAGAGTGLQALQSAFGYGPDARLLAVDLSAASLAYADTAARHFGAGNIEFLVADILDLGQLDRTFDVIECVGVLHHMADPWSGWRMLLAAVLMVEAIWFVTHGVHDDAGWAGLAQVVVGGVVGLVVYGAALVALGAPEVDAVRSLLRRRQTTA